MRGRRLEKPQAYSLEYVEDFSGRERRKCPQIVCRSRMALLGRTPRAAPSLVLWLAAGQVTEWRRRKSY